MYNAELASGIEAENGMMEAETEAGGGGGGYRYNNPSVKLVSGDWFG